MRIAGAAAGSRVVRLVANVDALEASPGAPGESGVRYIRYHVARAQAFGAAAGILRSPGVS